MTTVLIHPSSSLLSAYGMGLADIRATRQQAIEEPLGEDALRTIREVGSRLDRQAIAELEQQGVAAHSVFVQGHAHLRYAGTDTTLPVLAYTIRPRSKDDVPVAPETERMKLEFEQAHLARFGFIDQSKTIVVEALSVEAVFRTPKPDPAVAPPPRDAAPPAARIQFYSNGAWHAAALHLRDGLAPGHRVAGPAILIEPHQTVVVEDGWRAEITPHNDLVLTRVKPLPRTQAVGTDADPVMLEVFNNLFMSIAEQMGVALQNPAYSVNIKERLDFSCAVFDGQGSLVANAPHMPVHLGSMDRAVETIIRENKGRIAPGDVYAINAPYNGGTHLPDITVCTPVFDTPSLPSPASGGGKGRGEILFWVASRGHHADVGGISPGSMSPNATTI